MNLDLALETLRDIPDDELIEVGRQLQQDFFEAKARYEMARNEITARQDAQDSTLLVGEAAMVETKWTSEYEWDTGIVEEFAKSHLTWVPPVPGRWKVANTLALNNHIKKLGNTEAGQKLKLARNQKRKNPTLKFTTIIDSRGE